MRFPGLPVSRRRHLLEREVERTERARSERDAALIRVVELEQAIRQFCRHHHDDELVEDRGEAKRRLCAVLDGHDSYAHADPAGPCDSPEKVPVANVDSCQRCGHPIGSHDRQDRVGFRVEDHADVPDDVKLAPEPDTRDPECVERWPECETGAYDPRCCRFPKSCSADVHHDRQERHEGKPCYVCGGHWGSARRIYLGGEEHWRHAECQPPKAADVQGAEGGRR